MCEDYSARIVNSDEDDYYTGAGVETRDITYYIDDHLAIGRIELCFDGVWTAICEDVWTREDASVACHQLGFSRAG